VEQFVARNPFVIGGPIAPAQRLWDRRLELVLLQLPLLFPGVEYLQEQHPAQLADALGVSVDTPVFAHDVLYAFDRRTDAHSVPGSGATAVVSPLPLVLWCRGQRRWRRCRCR